MFAYGVGPPVDTTRTLLVAVPFAFVLATAPLLVLVTYVARLSAIGKRTATFGAFTPSVERS